jgi:hypothetical protein
MLEEIMCSLIDLIKDHCQIDEEEAESILAVYLTTESFVENLKLFAK